jgi:hypothetical protein
MTTVVFIGKWSSLPGVVDVEVGVQHVAHVAHLHAVVGELAFDHVLVELEAAHPERPHDRVVAVAGVHDDRILPAEDQEAVDRHPPRPPAVAPEDEERAFELDIAVVQYLDLQSHPGPSPQFSR